MSKPNYNSKENLQSQNTSMTSRADSKSETFKPLRNNIIKIKKVAQLIFKINLEGSLSTGYFTKEQLKLATLLGSGLLAINDNRSELMRIEDLKQQMEEATARRERAHETMISIENEIKEAYTEEQVNDFFEHLGIKEETKILPGGGLLR